MAEPLPIVYWRGLAKQRPDMTDLALAQIKRQLNQASKIGDRARVEQFRYLLLAHGAPKCPIQ